MIITMDAMRRYDKTSQQYPLRLLTSEKTILKPDNHFFAGPAHDHMLLFVWAGSVALDYEQQTIPLEQDSCVYVPRYKPFSLCAEQTAVCLWVEFAYDAPLPLLQQARLSILPATVKLRDGFDYLHRLCSLTSTLPGLPEALVLILLDGLHRQIRTPDDSLRLYQQCCDWIDAHAHTACTTADVSEALGYSTAHLGRVMRQIGGESLGQRIARRRIAQIKHCVLYSSLSLENIAVQLDFGSPELLRKFFRYHTGMRLTDYMRQTRGT